METLNDAVNAVRAELAATQVAMRALLLMQPDPDEARRLMTEHLERWIAHALASATADDVTIEAFARAKARLLPAAFDSSRSAPAG